MINHRSTLFALVAALALVGCSKTPSYNPSVGPFDEDGNYIEAWADNPGKYRKQTKPAAKPSSSAVASTPSAIGSRPAPKPAAVPTPPPVRQETYRPAPKPQPTVVAKPQPKPAVKVTPKPKPKPAVKVKPKPKPKPVPKTIIHKVVKGDTLYSLSRRYGTSVSAIQKANGMSGTNLSIGRSLKIPK